VKGNLVFLDIFIRSLQLKLIEEVNCEFFNFESLLKTCGNSVAPQILIVLFLIYLFDNIIQLISLRSLWYYGGW
jgi:hypothetical protein